MKGGHRDRACSFIAARYPTHRVPIVFPTSLVLIAPALPCSDVGVLGLVLVDADPEVRREALEGRCSSARDEIKEKRAGRERKHRDAICRHLEESVADDGPDGGRFGALLLFQTGPDLSRTRRSAESDDLGGETDPELLPAGHLAHERADRAFVFALAVDVTDDLSFCIVERLDLAKVGRARALVERLCFSEHDALASARLDLDEGLEEVLPVG